MTLCSNIVISELSSREGSRNPLCEERGRQRRLGDCAHMPRSCHGLKRLSARRLEDNRPRLPLGAGGNFVRFNGSVYEAVKARLDRRPVCDHQQQSAPCHFRLEPGEPQTNRRRTYQKEVRVIHSTQRDGSGSFIAGRNLDFA